MIALQAPKRAIQLQAGEQREPACQLQWLVGLALGDMFCLSPMLTLTHQNQVRSQLLREILVIFRLEGV